MPPLDAETGPKMAAAGLYAIGQVEPHRPGLVTPGETIVSYGEILHNVNLLSQGMQRAGMEPGSALVVVATNRLETIELYAAGMQIGLDVVLVNWHLTAREIEYLVDNSRAKMVVAEPRFADAVAAAADGAGLDSELRFSFGQAPGFRPLTEVVGGASDAAPVERHAGQALFYTSGTTGQPKAVRKNLGALPPDQITLMAGIGIRRETAALPPADEAAVTILPGPLYHAAPLAAAAGALDEGSMLVLMDRFDPARFLHLVETYGVTSASMVPTMFHRLLALPEALRQQADTSSLVAVTHAGAPCPIDVKRKMIEWWGPIITESYSSTEGAGTSISSEEWLERPGSVGRPSPGVSMVVVDDDGDPCPPGTPGRIFTSQTLWEFEYQGDPDKTARSRRDGMFTVGDIGYFDEDGYLYLCDRDSELIISGGVNIYPSEVEGVLLEHPAVADAVVIGVPNDEWGEEVRAVVEVRSGQSDDEALVDELIAHCRGQLASYKTPKGVDFVDSIGRDPNGKVRKQIIRDRYWSGRERRI
jgi:long-chain acyl-CoA synthetase